MALHPFPRPWFLAALILGAPQAVQAAAEARYAIVAPDHAQCSITMTHRITGKVILDKRKTDNDILDHAKDWALVRHNQIIQMDGGDLIQVDFILEFKRAGTTLAKVRFHGASNSPSVEPRGHVNEHFMMRLKKDKMIDFSL